VHPDPYILNPRQYVNELSGVRTFETTSLERAERLLGPGRVRYVHPDCGFWMLRRGIADAKIQALVAGRDLYEDRRG
jgi:methionine synthase II (cobalamin-independent)